LRGIILKSYTVIFWSGLILWIGSCLGIGVIGIRNSVWGRPFKPILSNLKPVDIKIAKACAVLFIIGLLLFILGFLVKE
jgi:hypothetical protein